MLLFHDKMTGFSQVQSDWFLHWAFHLLGNFGWPGLSFVAAGNISAAFPRDCWSLVGVLGCSQTCTCRRWIHWHRSGSLCWLVHSYYRFCVDSSGFHLYDNTMNPLVLQSSHVFCSSISFTRVQMGTDVISFVLQCSADHLLCGEAWICGVLMSAILRRLCRPKYVLRFFKWVCLSEK